MANPPPKGSLVDHGPLLGLAKYNVETAIVSLLESLLALVLLVPTSFSHNALAFASSSCFPMHYNSAFLGERVAFEIVDGREKEWLALLDLCLKGLVLFNGVREVANA